jgi:hypothetical protein
MGLNEEEELYYELKYGLITILKRQEEKMRRVIEDSNVYVEFNQFGDMILKADANVCCEQWRSHQRFPFSFLSQSQRDIEEHVGQFLCQFLIDIYRNGGK